MLGKLQWTGTMPLALKSNIIFRKEHGWDSSRDLKINIPPINKHMKNVQHH